MQSSIIKPTYLIKRQIWYLLISWTIIVMLSLGVSLYMNHKTIMKNAIHEARTHYDINVFYRLIIADWGGIYAFSDKVAPNPHLLVPNRDITTIDGEHLTLINPAYMTRLVFEKIKAESRQPVLNKITSLKTLNPVNNPDAWEREGLIAFEKGTKEVNEITNIFNKPYLRLMRPFITEASCLKCHGKQGYKIGDIRGGISIAVPMQSYYENEANLKKIIIVTHFLLWLLVGSIIIIFSKQEEKNAKAYEETKGLSLHDHLTGLANRRLMEIEFDIFFAKAKRYKNELSVMMLDIDDFKKFNDIYGHEKGDKILFEIAGIVKNEIRETDLAVRYGGEEFLVLLPQTGITETLEVAERIKKAVSKKTENTVSIGISIYHKEMQKKEEIIKKSDEALYLAKAKGKNRIEISS